MTFPSESEIYFNSPLLPTPGAPITAIFTSVRDDFLRRIPRMAFVVIAPERWKKLLVIEKNYFTLYKKLFY